MPDASKSVVRARTESHSDVANTPAARQYQQKLTEQQFSEAMLRRLREAKAVVHLTHFKDEWTAGDNAMTHELSVDVEEEASAD